METDQVAIALVKELRKQQLNVPGDISVLGFDDAEIAQAADLSTIRQEPIELGRMAGRKCCSSYVTNLLNIRMNCRILCWCAQHHKPH